MSSVSYPEKPKNTAGNRLKYVAYALIIGGIIVTTYLSYLKANQALAVCVQGGAFNCNVVLNSVYSELFGIPIAYLGWLVYIILGAMLLLESRVEFFQNNGRILMFGLALFAWVFSMYLVYLQFFVLQALCQWCLTHEAIMTVLFFLLVWRLWQGLQADDEEVIVE
ncbi:vitamin K epoxide reductase family protein [Phototrophicus methaneseepsis]|uniref:Vitamin K epoxide reductase family protein n=1 Tax=Phototrophicus methaneseepsis TaxID=2710758 RepID=A0A7S8E6Y8_9CHLR|nr:vitamin K epoxide reductase family protein [Phototrophicus methaneseepsis]QPC81443.1 vitamin K epoxide reductase family protein [Phototrophicus methaneseepsis]